MLTTADTKAIIYLNSIFLENSVSFKINKHNSNIILPSCINLENNIKVSRVIGFLIGKSLKHKFVKLTVQKLETHSFAGGNHKHL